MSALAALWRAARWLAQAAGAATAVAFFGGFVLFASRIESEEGPPPPHAGGVVALTGGADRIGDALSLLAEGKADRLLITGVNRATRKAEIARAMPESKNLFECCVDLGYDALNTIGNAEETRAWAHAHAITSLIVVTSNYHMPRALAEIARALPHATLVPFPVVSDHTRGLALWSDPPTARIVATEYVKYVVALVRIALTPGPAASPLVTAQRRPGER